jgi:hypothetical protein
MFATLTIAIIPAVSCSHGAFTILSPNEESPAVEERGSASVTSQK